VTAADAQEGEAEPLERLRAAAGSSRFAARPWLRLSRALREAGRLPEAQAAAARALRRRPLGPASIEEAGQAHAQARDRAALARVVRRLGPLRLHPWRVLRTVARWAELAEDPALADRVLAAARASGREEAMARLAVARLRHRAGDPQGARALVAGEAEADRRAQLELALSDGAAEDVLALLPALPGLPAPQKRRIARTLARRGHLSSAAELLRAAGPPPGQAADEDLDRVEGELAVLRDGWSPPPGRPVSVAPHPGRVLHLVWRSRPHAESGFAIRTHAVLRAQRDAGLEPAAVTRLGFPGRPVPGVEHLDGVAYHRVRPGAPPPVRVEALLAQSLEEVTRLAAELRPAALQPATNYVNGLLGLALRDRFGVPVVYEVRGFWEESWLARQPDEASGLASDRYAGERARELACMNGADRVVTLSQTMKAVLVERGVPEERVAVVPNAVDPDRFVPVARDPALARRLGLDGGEPVAGYVTSLNGYEGIDVLLRAVAGLRARGVRARVLIVGDGRERVRRQALAGELGLGGAAVFTGRVPHDDVLRHYGLIDVFVVPRTSNRVSRLVTPLKPFEALATERALVVSDVPPLREIVDPGRTGQIFRAGDPEDLAAVLEPLLEDPARRAALGSAGREWVRRERTWEANGRRYRDLMADLGVL